MAFDDDDEPIKLRTSMIGVRVDWEQKEMVERAAEREGLQMSSFLIMLLVRCRILPESSLDKLKRKPMPFYNALHGLLGVVNNIGGNFKQLSNAMPDTVGLKAAHASIIRAASAITETMRGRPLPTVLNFYEFQGRLTGVGYELNEIVRSVNKGQPRLEGLPGVLGSICLIADEITAMLTGQPVEITDPIYRADLAELAMEEMRLIMQKASKQHTQHRTDD
jgi:hypothetical protein